MIGCASAVRGPRSGPRSGARWRTGREAVLDRRDPARSPWRCGRGRAASSISSRYGSQALAVGARLGGGGPVGGPAEARHEPASESVDTSTGRICRVGGHLYGRFWRVAPPPGGPHREPGGLEVGRRRSPAARPSPLAMRRSVQPNRPRAMTCCFFASLKRLAMAAQGPRSLAPRQRLERLLPMAGFQVSMYGRFWVSTEEHRCSA